MAKHRRYTKKKSQRRNRSSSRKMRGGVDMPSEINTSQGPLNISDLNVSGQQSIINDQSQPGWHNWENPDYSGNTTFESEPSNITNQSSIISEPSEDSTLAIEPSFDEISVIENENEDDDSVVGDIDEFDEPDEPPFGGKRKIKRRYNSAKKNKRKTKKSKKTRKYRKRRQHGGRGFTTSVDTNPIQYKEDEYNQFNNMINYDPSKQ